MEKKEREKINIQELVDTKGIKEGARKKGAKERSRESPKKPHYLRLTLKL